MGWNGSDNANAAPEPRKAAKTPPSRWRGLIALLVIVLGGIAAWMLLRPAPKEPVQVKPVKPVKVAVPAKLVLPTTNVVEKAKPKAYSDMSREEKLAYFRNRYGDNIPDNLKSTVYFLENPPKYSYHPAQSRVSMFKKRSDRKIASVLLIKPGDFMLQPPTFNARFDADFDESLKENIEISDEDTPEDRELKEAVREVRAELVKLQREGESPSSVMQNEINSLVELGRYKHNLQKQLVEIRKDATYSDDDVRDFVTAANEMLTSKGLSGFKMPNLLTRQLSLQRAAETRKNKNNRD